MIIFVSTDDWRSFGFSPELWGGKTIQVEVPDDFQGGNLTYNPESGGWVADPIPERDYVAEANAHRLELLELYKATTADWNTDLLLGDISDEDKEKLIAWVAWRKEVAAVDTSTASAENPIIWPEVPAN